MITVELTISPKTHVPQYKVVAKTARMKKQLKRDNIINRRNAQVVAESIRRKEINERNAKNYDSKRRNRNNINSSSISVGH